MAQMRMQMQMQQQQMQQQQMQQRQQQMQQPALLPPGMVSPSGNAPTNMPSHARTTVSVPAPPGALPPGDGYSAADAWARAGGTFDARKSGGAAADFASGGGAGAGSGVSAPADSGKREGGDKESSARRPSAPPQDLNTNQMYASGHLRKISIPMGGGPLAQAMERAAAGAAGGGDDDGDDGDESCLECFCPCFFVPFPCYCVEDMKKVGLCPCLGK